MTNIQQIEIRHLFICPAHNFKKHQSGTPGETETVDVDKVECVTGRGLRGDRYFDYREDYKGQITFFSWEVYEGLKAEMGTNFSPVEMRRNVLVQGMDFESLIGKEFEISGVRMRGSEHCKPCFWMDEVCGEGAEAWLSPECRGGLRARISLRWLAEERAGRTAPSRMSIKIRPFEDADRDELLEALLESVSEVGRWMSWCRPDYDEHDAQMFINYAVTGWANESHYEFAVIGDGQILGAIGINQVIRGDRVANFGYWIRSAATGEGICTKAVETRHGLRLGTHRTQPPRNCGRGEECG